MAVRVEKGGGGVGSKPIDPHVEAGKLKEGLKATLDSARMDGTLTTNLIRKAAYQSLIAPTASGVPLYQLSPDEAQAVFEARAKAMKEFFESWAESIRKNAKADKKAAFVAMLKGARLKQVVKKARADLNAERARASGKGSTNQKPGSHSEVEVSVRGFSQASTHSTTVAPAGVSAALEPPRTLASNPLAGRRQVKRG